METDMLFWKPLWLSGTARKNNWKIKKILGSVPPPGKLKKDSYAILLTLKGKWLWKRGPGVADAFTKLARFAKKEDKK
jgi:hypothetical protein